MFSEVTALLKFRKIPFGFCVHESFLNPAEGEIHLFSLPDQEIQKMSHIKSHLDLSEEIFFLNQMK